MVWGAGTPAVVGLQGGRPAVWGEDGEYTGAGNSLTSGQSGIFLPYFTDEETGVFGSQGT